MRWSTNRSSLPQRARQYKSGVLAEKSKSHQRASLAIALLAAILTPGAYLVGLSYYQGYLSAFGVESDGFPVSAPDIYVFSYHSVGYFFLAFVGISVNAMEKVLSPPGIYWATGIIVISVGILYWLLRSIRIGFHPRIEYLLAKIKLVVSWLHWKNNDFTKSVGIVGVASYSVALFTTSVIAITLFWWIFPLASYSKGQDIAHERIKLFFEKGCHADPKSKWDMCFMVLDEKGSIVHEGVLIAVNSKEIAVFKKDGIYIFARKEDTLLKRKLH